MATYCAECGGQLPASARFCVRCGAQVMRIDGGVDTAPLSDLSNAPTQAIQPTQPTPTVPLVPQPPGQVSGSSTQPGAPTAPLPRASIPATPAPQSGDPGKGSGAAGPSSLGVVEQFTAWPDHAHRPEHSPEGAVERPPGWSSAEGGTHEGNFGAAPLPPGRPEEPHRKTPVWPVLLVLTLLVVGGVVSAFPALRGGNTPAPSPVTSASAAASSPAPSSTGLFSTATPSTTPPNADAQETRVAVGQVLDAGRGSRSTLVQGIDTYCSKKDKDGGKAQIEEALQGRMAQLAKLNEVGDAPFRKIDGGTDARDKLKAALRASAAADQVYVQMATAGTVCQGGLELAQANEQASAAKKAFLDTWNPLMTTAKLQPLANDDL